MNGARQHLPDRRRSEIYCFDLDGIAHRSQVSFFEDGWLGEIFVDVVCKPKIGGPKTGSSAEIAAHDAGVSASLALQFGCPAEVLRHALTKLSDGTSAGPIGRTLDLLAEDAAGGAP